MLTVYTLKTCDTCKKALKWLEQEAIAFENHDVRADGLSNETISQIVSGLGWEKALNRRSTTWRGLGESEKADIDNAKAVTLIEANPTLMKRPVIIRGNEMFAGFDANVQQALAG